MRIKTLKRLIAEDGKILRNTETGVTAYCVDVLEEKVEKWEEIVFRLRPPAGTYASTGTDNVRTRNPHDQKYPLHLYPYRYDHRRLAGLRHDTVHYLPYVGPAHTVGIHFDSFSALLFRFTFNRHLFRYCGHDRHHLYVYRQSQWYRSHLYRRRDLIRHLFRRPLFTDVDQRPSDQRTDAD